MNKIELRINTGVWNSSDTTTMAIMTAVGVIVALGGVLGTLTCCGINLGPLNALSTILPKECYCFVGALGGSVLIGTLGWAIYKSIVHYLRKSSLEGLSKRATRPTANLQDNQFEVDLYAHTFEFKNSSGALEQIRGLPSEAVLWTKNSVMLFHEVADCTLAINELIKKGMVEVPSLSARAAVQPQKLEHNYLEGHPGMYMWGIVVTVISLAAFIVPFFITFPYAWTVQTFALGVLTAVSYGIVNDMMAVRQSKHYFTEGHTPFHLRLLSSDDPNANAIVWGIFATWGLGALAGILLAVSGTVTETVAINPEYLAPFAGLGALGVCVYAHVKSKEMEHAYTSDAAKNALNAFYDKFEIEPQSSDFHRVYFRNVPDVERAGHHAVGTRNNIGYLAMSLLGVILLISLVVARVLLLKI